MGRQIAFYMMTEDQNAFLTYVQERDPVNVIFRDMDSPLVKPASGLIVERRTILILWNRSLLPRLGRKRVDVVSPPYYTVDVLRLPVLELSCSFRPSRDPQHGLAGGRLFGDFDTHLNKPLEFDKWYETLVRWIRKNFRKHPTRERGYVGPEAFDFYRSGGVLL
jgi:hypothetical protein